jgi:peptidyl-prolyl cis-trans isomerase D
MVSSSWFRRHKKTVYIVMIFSMFVWGISYSAMEMIPKKPIGTIFGRKITENEFLDMLGRWQRLFFSQARESVVSIVWKQLMYVEEAKNMGLVVTAQEIEEGLLRLGFQIFGGEVNINRPQLIQFLCNNFKLTQDQISRTLKEALLVEKLDSMICSSIKMTTEEIWQRYSLENEQVKFKALILKAKDFLDSVNTTEDEIRAFYDKYMNEEYNTDSDKPGYKLPERVKIECIIAKYDDLEEQVAVTEDEMKIYYEAKKEYQFKVTTVESKPADAKATSAAEKKVTKQEENKTITQYKPFTEVKEEIRKTISKQKSRDTSTETMNKLDEEIYETIDKAERPSFEKLASKYKLTYVIPAGKKSKSELLTENDLFELFPGNDQLVQTAFDRDVFESSVPFDFVEGKVIFQVIDKKSAAAAPFEEIRSHVINDLKHEKGLLKAKEVSEKYAGTKNNITLEDILKSIKTEYPQKNFSICETSYINRPIKLFNKESRYIEAFKEDRPNVAKKAFELKQGQFGIAIETSGEKACYIINPTDRKPADKALFAKDKDNLTKRFLYEKQEAFLADWRTDLGKNTEMFTKYQ